MNKRTAIVGIVGIQNSGKTTLGMKLVDAAKQMGLRVAVVKHDGHAVRDVRPDWGKPGSDTELYLSSGADVTLLAGGSYTSLTVHEEHELSARALVARLLTASKQRDEPLDVILIEGFKASEYPKIAVVRRKEDVEWLTAARLDSLFGVYQGDKECAVPEHVRVYTDEDIHQMIQAILHEC